MGFASLYPSYASCETRLPQSLIHHEAARDLQLADGAGEEALLRRMDIAPGGERELAEHAAVGVEGRKQPGQADRRMRAGVEGEQQELEMGEVALLRRRGEARDRRQ